MDKPTISPYSIEAEQGVISTLLLNADKHDVVSGILRADMFFDAELRTIYTAILSLLSKSKPVDFVTVQEEVKQYGVDVSISTLNDLAQFSSSPTSLYRYAEIISDRALSRGLMAAAQQSHEIALQAGVEATQRLDMCQQLFMGLAAKRVTREAKVVAELAVGIIDRVTELSEGKSLPGVAIGIPTLDAILGGGFKSGKQIIIAARPSVGKSALAMEVAYQFAAKGHPAAFLSQEMTTEELADRLVCRIGGIDAGNMATGRLSDNEWGYLSDAVEQFRTLPLYIDDQPGLSLADIQAKARKLKRERGIKVLILDYLQLCSATDGKASRHHQIEELSRGLKVLAKQLDLTTVILSQLNREVEKRTNARAMLADLKESGSIEEDADTVILMSQDCIRETGDVVVHAEIAKNRGGRKGFVKLAFTGKYQRFVETISEAQPVKKQREYTEDF